MITESLKDVSVSKDGIQNFSLDELKEFCTTVEPLPHGCSLCVFEKDELWIQFLLVEFHKSDLDEQHTRVTAVFEGEGTSGNLRECRHIFWGEKRDGHTFYLPAQAVIGALEKLKKYFDFE